MKSGYAPNWFCIQKDDDGKVSAMTKAEPGSNFATAMGIMGL